MLTNPEEAQFCKADTSLDPTAVGHGAGKVDAVPQDKTHTVQSPRIERADTKVQYLCVFMCLCAYVRVCVCVCVCVCARVWSPWLPCMFLRDRASYVPGMGRHRHGPCLAFLLHIYLSFTAYLC